MTGHRLRHLALLLAFALTAGAAFAQNDVLVRVMVLPPYPMNLQELVARQGETVVELQNLRPEPMEVELQVRVYSDDAGLEVRTDPTRSNGAPIALPANGIVRLTGAELTDFFDAARLLYTGITEAELRDRRAVPEGYYFVCGQVVEARTLTPVSQEVCSSPIAIMALEPPMLRLTNPRSGGDTVAQVTPQNLIFQWNVPSNVPAPLIPQLEYTLNLAEVPEGIDPQTIVGAAPAMTPGITVVGTNLFVYGPASPQLLPGQRYVATLTAQHPDGSLTFRNAGRSEPVSFVFGAAPDDGGVDPGTTTTGTGPALPPITTGSVRGTLRWAFRASEQPESPAGASAPPLLTDDPTALSLRAPTPRVVDTATAGPAYPLAGATLRLRFTPPATQGSLPPWLGTLVGSTPAAQTVATATSGPDGAFQFGEVQPNFLTGGQLSLEIDAGPQFVKRVVSVPAASFATGLDVDLAGVRVAANTFRLTTRVLADLLPPGAELRAELLARASLVAEQPYLTAATPGGGPVSYNGESWRVLRTITSGRSERGLILPKYGHDQFVLRVVASSGEETFVPLPLVPASDFQGTPNAPVLSYYRGVRLATPGLAVSGTATYGGQAREGARVRVRYVDAAMGAAVETEAQFTDASGFYRFSGLPYTAQDGRYEVVCVDTRLSPEASEKTVTWDGSRNELTANFQLRSTVYAVSGRIVDQRGMPMSGVRVSVRSGFSARTSPEGVFVLKYARKGDRLTIEGPDVNRPRRKPQLPRNPSAVSVAGGADWADLLRGTGAAATTSPAPTDAAFFGLTPGTLAASYRATIDAAEELIAFDDLGDVQVESLRPALVLHVLIDGSPVRAAVTIGGTERLESTADGPLVWAADPGTYTLAIDPVAGGPSFLPHYDELTLRPTVRVNGRAITRTVELTVNLRPAAVVSGLVVDSATRAPIAGALVQVEGLPYADTTDAGGAYALHLLRNRPVRIGISAAGYNTEYHETSFSGDTQRDYALLARDPNAPDIRTISGFPVVLDKLAPGTSPDVYMVSGTLSIATAGNGLYSVTAGTETIPFIDGAVKMLDDTTAIPVGPMVLDVVTLRTDAFGYAPVDVSGSPSLQLRAIKGSTPKQKRVAVIGGQTLLLNMSRFASIGGIPMSSFPKAYLSNDRFDYAALGLDQTAVANATGTAGMLGAQEFQGVFASPHKAMDYMSRGAKFSLVFAKAAPNFTTIKLKKEKKAKQDSTKAPLPFVKPTDATHIKGGLAGGLLKVHIDKELASVDSSAINFAGFLELPNPFKLIDWPNEGLVRLSAFQIGGGGVIKKLAAELDRAKPLRSKIGKWQLQLDRIILRGIGSPNIGVGAGGLVILKADTLGNVKPEDNLNIKELSFVLGSNGPTVIGELLFPTAGLQIASLRATTTRPVKVKAEASPVSLSFDGAGMLFYGDQGATHAQATGSATGTSTSSSGSGGQGGVLAQVFPLDIQRFIFRSADWSVFMAAAPNKEIDFKAIKIRVSKLLVNIGVGMSMDAMGNYLELTKAEKTLDPNKRTFIGTTPEILAYAQDRVDRAVAAGRTPDPTDQAMLDDAVRRGKVTVKQLRALVAQGNSSDKLLKSNQMSWAIGLAGTVEFPIKDMEAKAGGSLIVAGGGKGTQVRVNDLFLEVNSPAFHLSATGKMSFAPNKWGLEGGAELETLTKKFGATFKFYHHTSSSMQGVEFSASILASVGITTGPVMWHTIGGGFDFNTATQKYKVMALGELGPAGTPKEAVYARNVSLEVLFDIRNCGPVPIVSGTAGLALKNEDWGNVTAKLDFCRLLALVEVDTRKALLNGATAFDVRGVLFAQAPGGSRPEGGVFLGVNASTAIGTIARGNILAAVGINMDRQSTSTPSSVHAMWPRIHASALEGPYDNILHGVFVGAQLTLVRQLGSVSVPVGGFKAVEFTYDVAADGSGNFYKSFAREDFSVEAEVSASADVALSLLTIITLNGEVDVDADLAGGYTPARGWNFRGAGNAYLEVYDRKQTKCNTTEIVWHDVNCGWRSYWCGPAFWPWDKTCWKWECDRVPLPTYRFCVNLRGSFDLNQSSQSFALQVN